jgi:hypothetical protein
MNNLKSTIIKRLLILMTICISLVSFGQVPNYVPTNGLIGWWPFNGNANDESGNGNHGAINGNISLNVGYDGSPNSAYLWPNTNGSQNYINLGNLSQFLPGAITISQWVYFDGATSDSRVISTGEMGIIVHNDAANSVVMKCSYNPSGANIWPSSYNVTKFTWHHIVYSSEGGIARLYIDGILTDSSNSWVAPSTSNYSWNIGRKSISSFDGFGGVIDDIGIWNRSLTQCEILDLYNALLNSSNAVNAGPDQTVCEGSTITLSGSGGINYQWNNNVNNGVPFTPISTHDYVLTGEDVNGCLGIDTVTVEVLSNSTSSEIVTECNSYTWNTNGQTYTQSGQYTSVLINQFGCDSIVTLNLTINSSSSSIQTVTSLDSYTWSVNNQTYTQTGTYTALIQNASGCDSSISLVLTLQFTKLDENTTSCNALYPNPTCNSFTLSTNNMIKMNYSLIDNKGKVVLIGKIESTKETVDISKLSKGQYKLVFDDESIPVISVIKQ